MKRIHAITLFTPTRTAALERLTHFLPQAGRAYAAKRNYDLGPQQRDNVSALSPYVRHRMITETEVLAAVLHTHSMSAAEKFIQEVCWRTYWKGWLEQRPDVWRSYQRDLDSLVPMLDTAPLKNGYAYALAGKTGIDCFDFWVQELIDTGFLHNHARMWFASIWIFTLKLPWQLGADFFLRHLLDGDPASNTLSWRWVAGLHTKGKTYLARADNIRQYTDGRFEPKKLAGSANALEETGAASLAKIKALPAAPAGKAALLLTEEDMHPESMDFRDVDIVGIATLDASAARSPLDVSALVTDFTQQALTEAGARAAMHFSCTATQVAQESLVTWAVSLGVTTLITPFAPVGPARALLDKTAPVLIRHGIDLVPVRRPWDDMCWPHATKGFFNMKERIPEFITRAGLSASGMPLFDSDRT